MLLVRHGVLVPGTEGKKVLPRCTDDNVHVMLLAIAVNETLCVDLLHLRGEDMDIFLVQRFEKAIPGLFEDRVRMVSRRHRL